jgi:hypothetical protein
MIETRSGAATMETVGIIHRAAARQANRSPALDVRRNVRPERP